MPRIEDFAPPERFVLAGGIKTHFVRSGMSGPPVVLVHGFASNTYTWRGTLEALSDRARLYALDLKGFGLTEKPRDGQYHLNAYTQHLLNFLDAMQLDRVVLVGSSMGGAVATQLALQHPDRVLGLVLVDPAPISGRRPGARLGPFVLPAARPGANPGPASPRQAAAEVLLFRALANRAFIERGLRACYRDEGLVTPEMVEAYYRPFTIDGAAEAYLSMVRPPAEARTPPLPPASTLKQPILILWGRHDRIIPIATADRLARQMPGARLVIFEESGHMPHEEEPDKFYALLSGFLDRWRPGSTEDPTKEPGS